MPSFLKKKPRQARLYFDQNDELVDEETAMCDQNNYYHKYHVVEMDFGRADDEDEDYRVLNEMLGGVGRNSHKNSNAISKIDKITKETLYKEKPDENAEIFLTSL